ncbi:hypothetical protein JXA40_10145 [bacterium]|nr:hypothetical protein [candidate division CSSED10-310 bacterium]
MDKSDNQNRREVQFDWPVIDEPERAREAVQLTIVTSLMKLALSDRLPVKLNADIVRTFMQVCHMASFFERMIHADSAYAGYSAQIPMTLPSDMVIDAMREMMKLPATLELPGIDTIPAVLQRLNNLSIKTVDKNLVLNLDEACDQIYSLRETEKRCERQLDETHDSLQRAALLLEMGRESEAYTEFQQISQEDIRNNGNTLDLVDLIERFKGKAPALRALKQWFIFEISLHPVTFDLVADILFPGLRLDKAKRVEFLKRILFSERVRELEDLKNLMTLVLPFQDEFIPDKAEVETRMQKFGLQFQNMDFMPEDGEPICFYSLLTNICSQLNRLANLLLQADHRISALMAIDRCIIASLVLLFLPPRLEDIQVVMGFGSYNLCHEWIVENLRESQTILDTLRPRRLHERNFKKQLMHEMDFFREILAKFVCKTPSSATRFETN